MILYMKQGCPYCAKVIAAAKRLNMGFDAVKDIADEGVSVELVALGGRKMVPFLVDREAGVSMYESDDIVEYMEKKASDVSS